MRHISKIIVHCSDSPDDKDLGFVEINSWHEDRGWKSPAGISCGYHYIIRRNGVIECGRLIDEIGAHARGHNTPSIGICLIGRQEFDEKQFESLRRLVASLLDRYPNFIVYGHRDFNSGKTCPNFDVHQILGGEE